MHDMVGSVVVSLNLITFVRLGGIIGADSLDPVIGPYVVLGSPMVVDFFEKIIVILKHRTS